MIGKTHLNNVDLYSTYGIYIADGGYESLVSYPPLKPVPFNDWPEENGIEVDLSTPVLDTKTVTLPFVSEDFYKLRNFYNVLKQGGYPSFDFLEIGYQNVLLRLTGQQNLLITEGTTQWQFSLTFSDDFPLRSYNYQNPNADITPGEYDYKLDGNYFSQYGIRILRGSNAEVLKMPAIKQRLIRKYSDQPGILNGTPSQWTLDTYNPRSQSKEVTLNCLMTTDTLALFWRNYKSFLYDLKRPGPRYLNTAYVLPFIQQCFYKRSTVNQFLFDGGSVWCQFSLTLEFNDFAIDNMGYE